MAHIAGVDTRIEGQVIGQNLAGKDLKQGQPSLWSRQMLRPWMEAEDGLDADRARQVALDIQRKGIVAPGMSAELEGEVLRVIEKARKNFV